MKHRLVVVFAALALLFGVMGTSGIVADALGHSWTPQAHACSGNGSGGGGC